MLESTLAFLGGALLLAIILVKPKASGEPSPPSENGSCTRIGDRDSLGRELSSVGGSFYQDPWSLLDLPRPSDGILPDLYTLQSHFVSKVKEAQEAGAGLEKIQSLRNAYLAVLNATALLLRDRQYQELKMAQPTLQTTTIASEDVRRVIKHLEKDRNAFADQVGRMERWGSLLEGDLHASKLRIQELQGRLQEAEVYARCAPPWFSVWEDFLKQRCITGDDKRVGSTELHEEFVAFLLASCPQGEVPTHKSFRELLEHLGYAYDQVYVNGTNKRGFKGIALKV